MFLREKILGMSLSSLLSALERFQVLVVWAMSWPLERFWTTYLNLAPRVRGTSGASARWWPGCGSYGPSRPGEREHFIMVE